VSELEEGWLVLGVSEGEEKVEMVRDGVEAVE